MSSEGASAGQASQPVIIGRSSSLFTRVARIFAIEMRVDCGLRVVPELQSIDPADYGGNPALKLPSLETHAGVWFGALNICRELARRSSLRQRVSWPEHLDQPLLANAQELVLQAMATEVALIMSKLGGGGPSQHHAKLQKSLLGSMAWLEENARAALALLAPDRDLSYLEVTLFCLVTHLEFRDVLPMAPYPDLNELCRHFGARASAQQTAYAFDA